MKRANLPTGFPATAEAWDQLIAQAPDQVEDADCPYDPNDPQAVAAYWADPVVVPAGGYPAVKSALERRRRTRGPNRKPAKEQIAIRLSVDVLAAFRAGGPGWQTRIDAALREWVRSHPMG